jgi:hypothetical protein
MGTKVQTGAAVESIIKESFALETRNLSVTGLKAVPTVIQLK